MFKNYFITAIRNFIRQRMYSLINIGGLAIGIAVCFLILLWVNDELSFDKFHENYSNIHRVVENQYYAGGEVFPVAVTPAPLSASLVKDYPEIINATRVAGWGNTVTIGEEIFEEDGFWYVDSSFFDIFTIPFILGNPKDALKDPHSVVLTESVANKYFQDEDPLGKTIMGIGKVNLKITGVIKDLPKNSHMSFDFLAPFDFLKEWGVDMEEWGSNSFNTYVLLADNVDYNLVSEKIKDKIKENNEGSVTELFLQPLERIHLYDKGKFTADYAIQGDIQYVKIFSIIALFILIIACINFMNLATAKSTKRAREVGLRKVVGARRSQLIKQFFSESFILVFIALFISIVLVEFTLPFFNELSGKEMNFQIFSVEVLIGIGTFLVFTSLLSGSYPALFMSSFLPIKVLKGEIISGVKGATFRRLLVLFQFSISIFLIVGTIAINKQLDFIHKKNLGYNKENLVYFAIQGIEKDKKDVFRNELLRNSNIIDACYTQQTPVYMGNSSSGWNWEGKESDDVVLMHHNSVDHDFANTFDINMKHGRFFSREYPTDTSKGIVINETAAKVMGFEDPIGKHIYIYEDTVRVIGVVENFHFKPVHTKIEPLILHSSPSSHNIMFARVDGKNMNDALNYLENKFKEFAPASAFSYRVLDQQLVKVYKAEQQAKSVFTYFSILAIFIACLGLFGLASFASEQRTKEIGVRKAMGASAQQLTFLLSKDFTKYVLIANLIAWPAAYFLLDNWLKDFAYHINISIMFFIIAAVISFVIAVLTVSYHAIRSSLLSPIDSLRYE